MLSLLVFSAGSSVCRAGPAPASGQPRGNEPAGIACDGSRDERQRLADALASGGALAGRTLRLESGCKVLLGSPGAGRAALTLASNTRIDCADSSAGFVLARQSCRGGALPGAACDPANQDADCPGGGRCESDAGGPFAPQADGIYTVIAAEEGSVGTAVSGCGIWVDGVSGDSTATGGSGRRYGFCSGGKGDGFSCSQSCSPESGTLAGFACARDRDCGGNPGARCASVGECSALGGTCGAPPRETSWGPSGDGFIDPIDLRSSTGAFVSGVTIYDHRKGLFAIAIGSGVRKVERLNTDAQQNATTLGLSTVENCTTDAATTWLTPVGVLFAEVYDPRPFVDTGIVGGSVGSIVRDNRVAANRFGIRAYSSSTVSGNFIKLPIGVQEGAMALDTSPRGERLPSGIGLLASGNNSIFATNHVEAFIGFLNEPDRGFNVTVANNRFFNGTGPKIAIPSGAGVIVSGNYMAWGSSDNLDCSGPGQPLPCCTGSAAGTCAGPGVIRIGSSEPGARSGRVDHVDLIGNLIHSNQPNATYVLFDDPGRRCVKGDRPYDACGSDADCPDVASCTAGGQPRPCCSGAGAGSCVSSCRPTTYSNSFIADNHFHSGTANQTALDFSRLAAGSTTISGMTVEGNRIARFGRGVVLPRDPRSVERLDFLANDFTETASPSSICTGPGTPFGCCSAVGAGTCSVYEGWTWSMGERKGDSGLTTSDEQPVAVTFAVSPATALRRGEAVSITHDGGVERARRGSAVAGVALEDASPDGKSVAVAVSGVASCRVSSPVAPGERLAVGTAPGEVAPTTDAPGVALALTSGDGGQLVRCLVAAHA